MLSEKMLKGPWRITFDTNPDQCNINCIMCEEHSNYNLKKGNMNRIMDFQIIEEVIEEAVNYGLKEIIPSTMGEPLLYKNFIDLIELAKHRSLKINLTTNGTFPRLGAEEWAKLILPTASDVKISINGAIKETNELIMEGINFKKQISNIKNFVHNRDKIRKKGINHPTITFQTTFMKRNLKELPELLRLAILMDIDRFKGHHLWITHPELENESIKQDRDSIKQWNKIAEELYVIAESERFNNGRKIKLDNIYPILYSNKNNKILDDSICPFLGREAWIAWDGKFNVCCAPDNLRGKFGSFGNVKDNNFMELWTSKIYTDLIHNWGEYGVCGICNMRKPKKDLRGC